jgi:heat shock transcription factor 1
MIFFLFLDMDSKNLSSSNIGDGSHGEYSQQTAQSSQNPITAFLAKLWALVNDPSCDDLIAWDTSGGSFHVYDQARFAREILPRYFKHNNFASFIRQLNMYGFRKISTIEHGSLKNERDDIEFAHPNFIRGQESLLELIRRRAPDTHQKSNLQGGINQSFFHFFLNKIIIFHISGMSSALVSSNSLDSKTGCSIELAHLLDDVRNLQTKQTSLNDKLSYMQTEHEALWNEIGSLRQKHSKQQQIVSKLMEFLLQFLSANSAHGHEQSAGRQLSNESITTDLLHPQQAPTQHHTDNSSSILTEQDLSSNSLKRKHAALTHNDEPNKRTTMQQQPQFGRQQSITINELTDNDAGGWLHTTNTSPLVDLVPSPPPPQTQSTDDNYPQHQQQQQQTDYRWPTATNELLHPSGQTQQNKAFRTLGNGDNLANTYVPDFVLRTDNPSGMNINLGQPDGANLIGIKTVNIDAECCITII